MNRLKQGFVIAQPSGAIGQGDIETWSDYP
jgi:hypothetical protein